jgi:hypothetical protein
MLDFAEINVAAADTKGPQGDCVTRAISLVTGMPYHQVKQMVNEVLSNGRSNGSASWGVPVDTFRFQNFLKELGFRRCPVAPGTRLDDLPPGKWMVQVPKHMTVVKGGKIHDTFDPRKKKGLDRVQWVYVHEGFTGLSR